MKPDLAALLRGQVDDLLLSLDAGTSRVALTGLGDWGLCKEIGKHNQLRLATNTRRACGTNG